MLRTALTVALMQLPGDVPLPRELAGTNIEVVVQATQNYFAAENLSPFAQVLVFGDAEAGTLGTVRLDPGARVVYPFQRGAIDDVWVEVVSLDDDAWRNTGALSIGDVRDSVSGAMWVQGAPGRSVGWLDGESGLVHARPESGLLPTALLAAHTELRDFRIEAATHVPVPLPSDDDGGGDKPPVLEKKPLRPV